jgi:hypothetical protein
VSSVGSLKSNAVQIGLSVGELRLSGPIGWTCCEYRSKCRTTPKHYEKLQVLSELADGNRQVISLTPFMTATSINGEKPI